MSDFKPNKRQQEAIDNLKGQVMLLAGPGTGKTFTVVHRLKKMLDEGVSADKILCLSFSDAAAEEMRKKIREFFGKDLGVNIYTYHAFCNEIIAQNIETFGVSDNYRVINDTVSKQFIKECIDEYNPVAYRNDRNDPYVYFKQIKAGIEGIKKHRLSKTQYFHNIETNPDYKPEIARLKNEFEELKNKPDKGKREINRMEKIPSLIEEQELKILKAQEIWAYYELYKAKMEAEQYIDYDDMIGYVLDKFEESPAFLDTIANKYEYIMVDEYQDTNKNQNLIVFALVHALKSQNVFVVGDDDQIIYSFQGADLDTIGGFLKEFPKTKPTCLDENMRSTQPILNAARIVALQDDRRLEINQEFKQYNINKDLTAVNKELPNQNVKPRLKEYYNQEQEYFDIVQEIEALIESDDCPRDKKTNEKKLSEIAVIATSNEDIATIEQLLQDRNIPTEVKYGKSIFEIKSSMVLYYYLQTLVNSDEYSGQLFRLLLLPPFSFAPEDYKVLYDGYSFGKSFIQTMRENTKWKNADKINNFLETYDKLKEFSASETVKNIVTQVGAQTGIFEYFLNDEINRGENISGLKKLVDEAKDFSETHKQITLEDFVAYLDMVQSDRDIEIRIDKPDVALNAVQLTTYHSAKGKEYEYVYMPSLLSTKWESKSKSFKPVVPVSAEEWKDDDYWKLYKLSDAIKTMYVGMTRAKHTLRLSYYPTTKGKLNCWLAKAKDMGLLDYINASDYSLETHYMQAGKALVKRNYDYKRDFEMQIDATLAKLNYSSSSINEYIKCPRLYFYNNVLRFAGTYGSADAMSYGSAVHEALKYMTDEAIKNNSYPSKENFIAKFKEKLDLQAVSTPEMRKVYEGRGEIELDRFYPILTSTPISSIEKAEGEFNSELENKPFRGFIDLVLKKDDGTYKIVDYKTGKYPSASNVAPDKEHEEYYNQLCIYKYFYEKLYSVSVSETELLYTTEPTKPIVIAYTQEEIQAVLDKFTNSVQSIANHEFEPSYNKEHCKNCSYKAFCKMEVI